ncbi:MAG: chemosensory pili system protein ChpA (sensor histidine kinase/response regulator) [Pseudohongiellaceae bacterium]|jgi:chemosensory pili system protein ChpA (sensor histidine kinase/response regulator)
MADNRQYTALEWVVRDINETLQESQRVLENYASDPREVTQLRLCQGLVHQVYGSLEMVGFHGAAMIAEEIEELCQALLDNKINKPTEGLEVLTQAIVQLPPYLEKIQRTQRDYPTSAISLLNDIRSVRGANLLSESTLFTPKMSHAQVVVGNAASVTRDDVQLKLLISKLRKMYQYAAAGIANQVNVDKNYEYLLKVSDRLGKLLTGTKRFQIWHVAYAVVDGLSKGCIASSAGTRNLLCELDSELKELQQGGSDALNNFSDNTIIKNLLYYVSCANPSTSFIEKIKALYELDQMLPLTQMTNDHNQLIGIDASTLKAVTTAICEEFGEIKLKLDHCHQGNDCDDNLRAVRVGMQRVNDTLAILGVGELRRLVSDSVATIDLLLNREGAVTSDQLMNFAHQLISIELSLDSSLSVAGTASANPHHLDEAQQVVLKECRNGLEKSKDAIVDYIATQWDINQLYVVPELMRAVRGNLAILSLNKATDILSNCIAYIESQLIEQALKPQRQQLDSLADVIACVDYYIEFMSVARERDDSILDKAVSALALLGVSLESVAPVSSEGIVELVVPLAVDEADFIDDDLVDIFIDEVAEISETLDTHFPIWVQDFTNENSLLEVRRAFHTIKGGARMVKAIDVGELGWSIENLLNRIIDNTLEPNAAQTSLIAKVRVLLPEMVVAFKNRQANPHHELSQQYASWAALLAKGEDEDKILQVLSVLPVVAVGVENRCEHLAEAAVGVQVKAADAGIDAQLWAIFHAEAESHINAVEEYIQRMEIQRPLYDPPSDLMQRALHTLKGSAYMADLTSVAELMAPLESFAKELRSYQVSIDDDIFQLIKDGMLYTQEALVDISKLTYPAIVKSEQFRARIDELRERSVGPLIRQKEAEKADQKVDPAVLEVLMAEEMHLLLDADLMIAQWLKIPATMSDWLALHDELATLCHGAERANLQLMAHLSSLLQGVYSQLMNGEVVANSQSYNTLLAGHNELMNIVDAIAAGQDLPQPSEEVLQKLQSLPTINSFDTALNELNSTTMDEREGLSKNSYSETCIDRSDESINASTVQTLTGQSATLSAELSLENLDEDIIEIFLEEARELLEELDESIDGWGSGIIDRGRNELMQRTLHTFKGGARLAGLTGLGDLSHNYETFLISQTNSEQSDVTLREVNQFQDKMTRQVDRVEQLFNSPGGAIGKLAVDQPDEFSTRSNREPASAGDHTNRLWSTGLNEGSKSGKNVVAFGGRSSPLTILGDVVSAKISQTNTDTSAALARRNQPQEMVKVSADLMEELVNLAGETSISRGRMEEQISEFGYSLDDMGSTLQRLQDQIRRLDIETEAQAIFRQEQMTGSEDFDPLEMDRYSQLQQLSRSLIESVSDLMDLKGTLSDQARNAESVLLQQSRINTDLQEGLMRSRMVPFSRIVPRLRRIIRQISTELNKNVELEVGNIEGELDRGMMERMVAPLEHMLRNAIDHGIETQAVRDSAGKASTGRIVISLDRDGSDVLVLVADDGGGIDINRVRQKAIDSNLIHSNADLSDQEILQFILHAGFSTAETITQISGRGVGMDVVNSEIRLMGGSIAINSQLGEGTVFTIRVPFTVSVNRALMINMGEDRYAIPLNTIEGIVRVSPFELEYYYANPNELFQYANQEYQLRHLSTLLDDSVSAPRMESHTLPLPVILVRSSDHSVAFQVDSLRGSREIVVKSLGPQFKSVLGVSGATIMGDGRVVVILDPNALIRSSLSQNLTDQANTQLIALEKVAEKPPLVMVVDDSVTVRKVTSRLLEREGYDVITAKDGVDAMILLQDRQPDIMLLDIEMPRMDGFDVAKRVRSSQHHQALPIIMITSRTGEKHRLRGLEAGANLYMGKPYQEEALLESIRGLIKNEFISI